MILYLFLLFVLKKFFIDLIFFLKYCSGFGVSKVFNLIYWFNCNDIFYFKIVIFNFNIWCVFRFYEICNICVEVYVMCKFIVEYFSGVEYFKDFFLLFKFWV